MRCCGKWAEITRGEMKGWLQAFAGPLAASWQTSGPEMWNTKKTNCQIIFKQTTRTALAEYFVCSLTRVSFEILPYTWNINQVQLLQHDSLDVIYLFTLPGIHNRVYSNIVKYYYNLICVFYFKIFKMSFILVMTKLNFSHYPMSHDPSKIILICCSIIIINEYD